MGIGIEYAKIFRKLGANVTMLIRSAAKSSLERIGIDRDIADELLASLRKDNVLIYEGTSVSEYHVPVDRSEKVRIKLKSSDKDIPTEINCDVYLAALGR